GPAVHDLDPGAARRKRARQLGPRKPLGRTGPEDDELRLERCDELEIRRGEILEFLNGPVADGRRSNEYATGVAHVVHRHVAVAIAGEELPALIACKVELHVRDFKSTQQNEGIPAGS